MTRSILIERHCGERKGKSKRLRRRREGVRRMEEKSLVSQYLGCINLKPSSSVTYVRVCVCVCWLWMAYLTAQG